MEISCKMFYLEMNKRLESSERYLNKRFIKKGIKSSNFNCRLFHIIFSMELKFPFEGIMIFVYSLTRVSLCTVVHVDFFVPPEHPDSPRGLTTGQRRTT